MPSLYEEVRVGKVQNFGLPLAEQPKLVLISTQGTRAAGRKDLEEVLVEANRGNTAPQQPSLFDFARKRRDVVLSSN